MFDLLSLSIFCIVSLAAYYVVYRYRNRRLYELAGRLPGHEKYSIFGSFWLMLSMPRQDYVPCVMDLIKDEQQVTKVWLFNKLMILTKDADFINKVFNMHQTYNKPDLFYKGFMTTKGLITLAGSEHKRHRKVLNKAFTSKMMQRLPDIFDDKSKKIIKNLCQVENCGEFELLEFIGPYSLETFGKSNLNYEIQYHKSDIFHAYDNYSSVAVDYLAYSMMGVSQSLISFTKLGQRIKDTFQKFDAYFDNVIKVNSQNNNNNNIGTDPTAIDILLDPNNGFTEEEIKDELIMMLLGAFETSTRIISMTLMMLGMHQDVQHKLIKEINDVYSTEEKDVKFTTDFLQKFPYLEMVLKETMRLFAVVPLVARETSEDVDINGYTIPKNTTILMSIYAMQRDEKYWGCDAHLFRPERLENGMEYPHAWAPFTGGSRICIGYRYAMLAMKVFLINFFRTYTVDCSQKFEDIKSEMTMTLNFLTGYKVSIHRK
ncbi:probable cytochrome P450 313a4 [Chironomus tepperi]|uniref:probable cytochrome P450 313a4 n=1 Tax=Chironomus tepperi TaxID=113505 RepID=UPI00391FBC53